jgi:bla regulator protein BlaR1
MTIADLWRPEWTAALFNHLWQSTLVLFLAWLLTLALRRNPARIRYSVWMFASVKFLVPFALLADLGARWIHPAAGAGAGSALYTAAAQIGQPFQQAIAPAAPIAASASPSPWLALVPAVLAGIWLCGFVILLLRWAARWRQIACIAADALPTNQGREAEALRRAEIDAGLRPRIPLRTSERAIEPGIFGIFDPVLLWPAAISAHLNDAQIESIVAHEVEHVRRRDNLTAAIHLLVEAAFWFHPAVRWMGKRLMEERERACDEKVLESSARPETYAESILKVCAFCLEPPAPCVAGVSGADLKQRVLRIMTHRSLVNLSLVRKLALGAAALLVLAVPVGFGVLHAMQSPAAESPEASDISPDIPKFDVATIKPASSSDQKAGFMMSPDGIDLHGVPVQMMLREAFRVNDDEIVGAPGWVKTSRYDVQAKVAPEDAPRMDKLTRNQRRAMLVPLLTGRFNLKYHREQRELPVYVLVVAKGGIKMKPGKAPDHQAPPMPGDGPVTLKPGAGPPPAGPGNRARSRWGQGLLMMRPGHVEAANSNIEMLAHVLSDQLGRTVIDKTGLTGNYDYTLQWTPENTPPPMPGDAPGGPRNENGSEPVGPSLLTAVQEQLGLKLESEKGNVDVIVIDHIEPPSPN